MSVRIVTKGARGKREGPVGDVEATDVGGPLGWRRHAGSYDDMAALRRAAQRLASLPPEFDQRVDGAGMEPMRSEINGAPPQHTRDRASADPLARFKNRDGNPRRHEPPRGSDPGGARSDDNDIRFGRRRNERGSGGWRVRGVHGSALQGRRAGLTSAVAWASRRFASGVAHPLLLTF